MNSKEFVSNLVKATGSKTKTKKIILECYNTTVTEKILTKKFTLEQIGKDLKNFITWLHRIKKIDVQPLVEEITDIPPVNNKTNVDKIRDRIDTMFENKLDNSTVHRMEYNVLKLLQWLNNSQGLNITTVKQEVKEYLSNLKMNSGDDQDAMFDTINEIFSNNLPHDYDFYEQIFENSENKRIKLRIRQTVIPKFEIVDKYDIKLGINNNIVLPSVKQIEQRELRRNVNIDPKNKEAKKLAKIDKMVQGGLDSTLKKDYENLDSISNSLTNEETMYAIKNTWKDNVYKYLQKNKLKPRTLNRNSLYVYTVFLVLKKPFETVLESAETVLEINDISVSKNGYAISTITKMIGKGYLSNFSSKLQKYLNPDTDLSPVIDYLKDKDVPNRNIKLIVDKIYDLIGDSNNERVKLESIYVVLKDSNLRDYDIKVTRSMVKSLY